MCAGFPSSGRADTEPLWTKQQQSPEPSEGESEHRKCKQRESLGNVTSEQPAAISAPGTVPCCLLCQVRALPLHVYGLIFSWEGFLPGSLCSNICVIHLSFGLQTFLIPTVPWGEICVGDGGDVGHPSGLSSPAFPTAAACTWDSLARDGCKHGAAASSTGAGTQPRSPERSVVEELLRNSLDKAYGKQGTALCTDWGGVQPHAPAPALQGLLVQCWYWHFTVLTWEGEVSAVSRDAMRDAAWARSETVIDEWDEEFDRGKVGAELHPEECRVVGCASTWVHSSSLCVGEKG